MKTDAFLLRSVDYRDADRIFTMLTREKGKIPGLARNARKSERRYGGALSPFARIEMVLTPGSGRMWYIKEATLLRSNDGLSDHLWRIGAASYILEFVRESLPEETPDVPMFEFVDKILSLLCRVDTESVPKLLIAGALKLVGLSGIAMGLDYCSSCGKPVPKRRPVLFHPGRGGVICTPCGGGPVRLEPDTISALQRLGSCLIEQAASLDVPAAALAGCEIVISDFIEHHLGRPLKTRSVVIQMHSPPLG